MTFGRKSQYLMKMKMEKKCLQYKALTSDPLSWCRQMLVHSECLSP